MEEDTFTEEELQMFSEQIPDLDVKTGLCYCMDSKSFYIEMLEQFTTGNKDEELTAFLQKEDLENYRIAVHALKSNAKTIGAAELSENAKTQEMAAKEKRGEEVQANHLILTKQYKELQNRICIILDRM